MFNRTRTDTAVNLLEIRPSRNIQYEVTADERVVLLVPKFQNKYAVKWIMPHIRKKFFRVRLDSYGSFVWIRCDGSATIAQISEQLKEKFGENVDPTYGRIRRFVQMFLKDKFLTLPG